MDVERLLRDMEDMRQQIGGVRSSSLVAEQQVRVLRGRLDSLSISLHTEVADSLHGRLEHLEGRADSGDRWLSQLEANCQRQARGHGEMIEGLAKRVEELSGRAPGAPPPSALAGGLESLAAELRQEKEQLRGLARALEDERSEREELGKTLGDVRAGVAAGRAERAVLGGELEAVRESAQLGLREVGAAMEALEGRVREQLEVVRALAGARSDGGAREQTEAGVRELVDAAVVAAIGGTRDALLRELDGFDARLLGQRDALHDALEDALRREGAAREEAVGALREALNVHFRSEKDGCSAQALDAMRDDLLARVSSQAAHLSALDGRLAEISEKEACERQNLPELIEAGCARQLEGISISLEPAQLEGCARQLEGISMRQEGLSSQLQGLSMHLEDFQQRLATLEGFVDALRTSRPEPARRPSDRRPERRVSEPAASP